MANENIDIKAVNNSANDAELNKMQPSTELPKNAQTNNVQKKFKKYMWIGLCAIILAVLAVFISFNIIGQKSEGNHKPNLGKAVASVCVGNKFGLINQKGEWVMEPQFALPVRFNGNDIAPASRSENGRWGYIKLEGEWVIEQQFASAGDFSENGLAFAREIVDDSDGLCGFIDKNGNWVIEPQFGGAKEFSENGLAAACEVGDDGLWGFIDKNGNWVIEPQFEEENIPEFSENGLAAAEYGDDGLWGYIDEKGNWVIEPQFGYARNFSENGFAAAGEVSEGPFDYGNWGIIDEKGIWVVEPQFYGNLPVFSKNGLAVARTEDVIGYGYINEKGEWIVKPEYGDALPYIDDGFALVSKNKEWRIINSDGDTVKRLGENVPVNRQNNNDFIVYTRDGYNYKCGMMNWSGEIIFEPKFDVITPVN